MFNAEECEMDHKYRDKVIHDYEVAEANFFHLHSGAQFLQTKSAVR
jgi:hypothetical protein